MGSATALTFPMSVGATAVLFDGRPTPDAVFDILRREQPTIFCSGPTGYAAILADPKCTRDAGSPRLRLCLSAGEALPEHIGNAWKQRFGVDIVDGVGSTEMLHIFLSNTPGDIRYGTSGRAVPGYELRLLDEQGREVADDEIGELFVSGPSAAEGYWNQRDKSRSTFGGAWTRTGDKFIRDREGRYTYCGRTDDMFKVSGVWVSPFEVESALISHPAILEAAVIPHADADGLLKPKAYVVLKNRAQAARRSTRRCASTSRRPSDRGNIRAGSRCSTACRRPRPARSNASSCARWTRSGSEAGTAVAPSPRACGGGRERSSPEGAPLAQVPRGFPLPALPRERGRERKRSGSTTSNP